MNYEALEQRNALMGGGRKIKFRAWNEAEQKMYSNVGINPHAGGRSVFDKDGAILDMYGSAPILMQFTGLLDVNGREIYEGDIVQYPVFGIKGIVTWVAANPGFVVFDSAHARAHGLHSGFEVIGNLYEGTTVKHD